MELDLSTQIALITLVFLIMPVFMLTYFWIYTRKKKHHQHEKLNMKQHFDQELTLSQQEAREQTMQTIGADLHDNIGQLLSLTALTLKSIPGEPGPKVTEKVNTSIDLLTKAINELRQLGKLLQGDQLLAQGLKAAIDLEVEWLSRNTTYTIHFTNDKANSPNNSDIDLFYFRILQEILNNIIKHAQATHIAISLTGDDQLLTLQVTDNGIGFDTEAQSNLGSGLTNIKKRAAVLGAALQIESSPGRGTTITLQTPYP